MITIVLDDDDEDVRNAGKPGVSPVLRKTDVATVCEQECVDFYSPGQFGGEICASTKGGRGSCSVSFFLSRSLSLSLSLSLANDFGVSLISSDFSIFSAFEAIELLSDRENATPPTTTTTTTTTTRKKRTKKKKTTIFHWGVSVRPAARRRPHVVGAVRAVDKTK